MRAFGRGHLNGIRPLISIFISVGLFGGSNSYLKLCCPGGDFDSIPVVIEVDDNSNSHFTMRSMKGTPAVSPEDILG